MALYEGVVKANFNNFIEYGWNNANMDSLRGVLAENYVKHLNGIQIAANQSEMEANMNIYFTGFPDGEVSIDNVLIKNNNLFANWTYSGTNTGVFGETPPTGKKINIQGSCNLQFNEKGEILREAVYFNELELLQQLGYTLNPPVLE